MEGSKILLLEAVPCILLLENRCREKILRTLLIQGMNNQDGETKSQKLFIIAFQNKVNKCILGRKKMPAQWHIPLADDGKAIVEVNLPNVCIRKIIKQFSILTDMVFASNEDEHVKLNQCVDFYRQSIELL